MFYFLRRHVPGWWYGGVLVLCSVLLPQQVGATGVEWTARTGTGIGVWSAGAVSGDGSTFVVAQSGTTSFDNNGSIYTSTDGGTTWIERTEAGVRHWTDLAISEDGSIIVATTDTGLNGHVSSGYIYVSTDGGATWAERTGIGSGSWVAAAVASGGSLIAVGASNGSIYTSTDDGSSWTEQTGAGTHSWQSIDISADGQTIIAAAGGVDTLDSLFMSLDGGEVWAEKTNAGSRKWLSVSLSDDGFSAAAAAYNTPSSVYVTEDGGETWTTKSAPTLQLPKVSLSASSTRLLLSDNFSTGKVHASGDFGDTWVQQTSAGGHFWEEVALSADGQNALAIPSDSSGAYVYTAFFNYAAPAISGVGTTTGVSSTTIVWTTDLTADSQIYYGTTTDYGSQTTLASGLVTSHTVSVTGLDCETTYHYQIRSRSELGVLATTSDATFTTDVCVPAVISSVSADPSMTSATITWTTDVNATSQVEYGLTSTYTASSSLDATLQTSHSVSVSGLECATVYHYRVLSNSAGDESAASSDTTFTTSACPTGVMFEWTDVTTGTAAEDLGFYGFAQSANGAVAITGDTTGGNIWRSTDGGSTWTDVTTGTAAEGQSFSRFAGSADGSIFFAAESTTGNIWRSTDSASTWTNVTTGSDVDGFSFRSVVLSSDGSTVFATDDTLGTIWRSTDGGDTWADVTTGTAAEGYSLYGLAMSADESIIMAGGENSAWRSTDGGDTWADVTTGTDAESLGFYRLAMSADGSIIVAEDESAGDLWRSTDGGVTWANVTAGTDAEALYFQHVAMSADSSVIVAGDNNAGNIWVSTDGGVTWINNTITTDAEDLNFYSSFFAMPADASSVITGDDTTLNIWVGTPTTPTLSSIASTPSASGATITWTSDLESSSKVSYGTSDSYGSVTTEADTGTRVTSHSVTLSGLAACTTYHYAVTSRTAVTGAATSTDNTFTTIGMCGGGDDEEEEVPSRARSGVSIQSPSVAVGAVSAPGRLTSVQTQSILDLLKSFGADAAVVAQVAATLGKPAPVPPGTFTRNLELNMMGADVRALQVYLNTHGFVIAGAGPGAPGNETTIFGTLTYQALVRFQQANNLPATGYFGPLTRALIGNN